MKHVTIWSELKFWHWRLRSREIGVALLLFCLSFFLVILSWILAADALNGEFTMASLFSLHLRQPILFLTDFFPVFIGFGYLFLQSRNTTLIIELEKENEAQSQSMEEKADLPWLSAMGNTMPLLRYKILRTTVWDDPYSECATTCWRILKRKMSIRGLRAGKMKWLTSFVCIPICKS